MEKNMHNDLPDMPEPKPITPLNEWNVNLDKTIHVSPLYRFVDGNMASDSQQRSSISSIIYMMAGAAVIYKTKFQRTVVISSTEAEFVAASEAGKYALYLQSLLNDLDEPQQHATILYKDNVGAFLMTDAGQPTPHTHHIDIKHFALLDWVEEDLVKLQKFTTSLNSAYNMTKPNAHILFHRHNNVTMEKINAILFHKVSKCFAFPVR